MEGHTKKVYVGIDWGTHSSKWAADVVTEENDDIFLTNIISSDLLIDAGKITMAPPDSHLPDIERISSFKRYIIKDPYTPFWACRDDINMSMGSGVVFSICTLLGNFIAELTERELISVVNSTEIEVGFSFPNWLKENDSGSRTAARNYHEAIVISCCLFKIWTDNLPNPGELYSVKEWEELISKIRKDIVFPADSRVSIGDMTTTEYEPYDFSIGENDNKLKWRYLVESCAAGLPYLRSIELKTPPGVPGLGKLLIIDIGAGSTDIGYMLRTISIKDGSENLFYFPPAATLPIAGNVLTEAIKDFNDSIGRSITFKEAENYKITMTSEWINKDFAERWKKDICKHIKDYIKNSPDRRWLDVNMPLEIIITGGSAVIEGLSTEVRKTVNKGLKERGLQSDVADNVEIISDNIFAKVFRIKDDYARMAVAIGSADKDKPSLKYLSEMSPPTRIDSGVVKY